MKVKFYCPCCSEELVATVDDNKVEIEIVELPPDTELSQMLKESNIEFG
jgi:hypothetical protein